MTHIAKNVSNDTELLTSESPVTPLKKSLRYDCIPPKFMNSLFTPDQIQDLREEFIEFEINEMSTEEMASFIRNQKLKEYNLYTEDMLRQ